MYSALQIGTRTLVNPNSGSDRQVADRRLQCREVFDRKKEKKKRCRKGIMIGRNKEKETPEIEKEKCDVLLPSP